MATYCREVQEWVEEKIEKPIEEWVEKEEKKCKKKKCKKWCLCCNKWFCWIEVILVKVVKWVVVTVGKWVVRVVCEVIHVVLDIVAVLVGLVFAIPIIGGLIREIWDFLVELGWRIIGIPGLIADLLGLDWEKRLRACVIILRSDRGEVATAASLTPAIDAAKVIYKSAANVKLTIEAIHTVKSKSPDRNLVVGCDAEGWWEDLWLEGSYFEITANTQCFDGAGRRLIGLADPIVVFAVLEVEGSTAGCSLGPFSSYVTVEGPNPVCFAHELGHACSLWHHDNSDNLLFAQCGGTKLKKWQRVVLRNSRHVTYI